MNFITVMRGNLSNILRVEVDYYTRTEFIRKLHEAVINEKSKPPVFPKPSHKGPATIPSETSMITLEEDVQGINAAKLIASSI